MLPTIKEIAKRLKVSPSTVSRALHNHPSIGLVTTMRVQKMAQDINYVPNQAAICFKQRKTFTIGVILPYLSETFFSSAVSGIEDHADKQNYNIIIGQSLDDPQREKRILNTMKNHRVDGVIVSISKNTVNYDHFAQLKNCNIPIVFFDCIPEMDGINYIACNLETGILQAINKLVIKGHRTIGLINGPPKLLASKDRMEAYIKGLQNNNIEIDTNLMVITDLLSKGNRDAMQQLLSAKERPTAVIAFNDYVTLDAMALAKQNNLVINKEISFVSFANLGIWAYMDTPPVASIEQFPYKQGDKATEILFRLMGQDSENATISPINYNIFFDSHLVCLVPGNSNLIN